MTRQVRLCRDCEVPLGIGIHGNIRLCPDCRRARRRENSQRWRAANPDKARENARRWYAANPDKAREHARRWYAANRAAIKAAAVWGCPIAEARRRLAEAPR